MTNIPGAFEFIQQESVQFNNPVSESSLSSMGATLNGLLSIVLPVGSIVESMLTEAQFQLQIGNLAPPYLWILADGRGVSGSTYSTVTGFNNVPDLRSVNLRGKDNGRGLNPNGDLPLGTYTADTIVSHTHAISDPGHAHSISDPGHAHALSQPRGASSPGGGNQAPPSDGQFSFNPNAVIAALTGIAGANANFTGITGTGATGSAETGGKTVTVNIMIRIN